MPVIADADEHIENTDQHEYRSEDAAELRFAEEEDLCNSNENEHESHANVHAGCIQAAFGRI